MSNITELFTTYKVLEIREPVGGDVCSPIIIIAERSESKARRRIEVYRTNREMARSAKMLIAGDIVCIREWKMDDGRRILKGLVTYFNEEELEEDES